MIFKQLKNLLAEMRREIKTEKKKAEKEQAEADFEENRIQDLKAYCQKKNLDFDTENAKYLEKKMKKEAKKVAKR